MVAVDVPVTGSPYVAETIRHGVELAASNLNGGGGILVGTQRYRLVVKLYDNHLSARDAVADTRRALDAGALALVTDGTGVDATWQIAARDHMPICIGYDGGTGLVDPSKRPNVFRIAPTNHGIAFRYGEYLIPKHLKVALVHDDSAYGQEGASDMDRAFSENPGSVATRMTVPAGRPTSRLRSSACAARGRPRSSCGANRLRSRPCSPRPAASAGRFPSTPRRRGPTRSSASSSQTTRAG